MNLYCMLCKREAFDSREFCGRYFVWKIPDSIILNRTRNNDGKLAKAFPHILCTNVKLAEPIFSTWIQKCSNSIHIYVYAIRIQSLICENICIFLWTRDPQKFTYEKNERTEEKSGRMRGEM